MKKIEHDAEAYVRAKNFLDRLKEYGFTIQQYRLIKRMALDGDFSGAERAVQTILKGD